MKINLNFPVLDGPISIDSHTVFTVENVTVFSSLVKHFYQYSEDGLLKLFDEKLNADRLGVEIRQADGSYWNLSGNQIGALIAKYILEAHK
ncbi:hypothetical protein MXZ25_06080, partial [Streptococcus uberis]|nr:hypothetical protein [Streptococcus uberis]